jgi:hypothetical protein
MESSWTAYSALLVWPLVSIALYMSRSLCQATVGTILGAYLLLPVGTTIKFEMLPPIDKNTVPAFCALVGCLIFSKRIHQDKGSGRTGFGFVVALLMVAYVLGALASSLLNNDPILIGERFLPGTGIYDGISAVEAAIISLIPFYLGRKYFWSPSDSVEILRLLVAAGLIYSLLMLFEIRFSPQLHRWVYGFFPTDFQQQIRGEGFRPMVFTGHGLIAALFLVTAVVASAAMAKARYRVLGFAASTANIYLSAVLVLCRSAGAIVYGALAVALIWLASPRTQVRVAVVLVTFSLGYPILRSLDLVPTNFIVDVSRFAGDERARSIAFRFQNEDLLLDRASQRPFFGWGRYGRNRVYDPETGKDIAVSDGKWIQTFGQFGIVGFLSEFGLLSLAVYLSISAIKLCQRRDGILLAALSLIVGLSIVDLLPNSTLRPWTWFVCGVLLGRAENCVTAWRTVGRRPPLPSNAIGH